MAMRNSEPSPQPPVRSHQPVAHVERRDRHQPRRDRRRLRAIDGGDQHDLVVEQCRIADAVLRPRARWTSSTTASMRAGCRPRRGGRPAASRACGSRRRPPARDGPTARSSGDIAKCSSRRCSATRRSPRARSTRCSAISRASGGHTARSSRRRPAGRQITQGEQAREREAELRQAVVLLAVGRILDLQHAKQALARMDRRDVHALDAERLQVERGQLLGARIAPGDRRIDLGQSPRGPRTASGTRRDRARRRRYGRWPTGSKLSSHTSVRPLAARYQTPTRLAWQISAARSVASRTPSGVSRSIRLERAASSASVWARASSAWCRSRAARSRRSACRLRHIIRTASADHQQEHHARHRERELAARSDEAQEIQFGRHDQHRPVAAGQRLQRAGRDDDALAAEVEQLAAEALDLELVVDAGQQWIAELVELRQRRAFLGIGDPAVGRERRSPGPWRRSPEPCRAGRSPGS